MQQIHKNLFSCLRTTKEELKDLGKVYIMNILVNIQQASQKVHMDFMKTINA